MPLYDFECTRCGTTFEELVRGDAGPECAECGSAEVNRLPATASVHTVATSSLSTRAARSRDARQARDRMHERLRYEKSHDRHG